MRCLQRASAFFTNEARIYKCMGFSPDAQTTVPDDAPPEETYRFHALVTVVPETLSYSRSGVLSFSFSTSRRVGVTVLFGIGGLSSPGRLRVSRASAPVTFEGRPEPQLFTSSAPGGDGAAGNGSKALVVFTAYSDHGPLTDTSPNAQIMLVDVAPGADGGGRGDSPARPILLSSIIRIGASFYSLEKVYGAAETAVQLGAASSTAGAQEGQSGRSGASAAPATSATSGAQSSAGSASRPVPTGQLSGQMLAARLSELQRQSGGRGSSRLAASSRRSGARRSARGARNASASSESQSAAALRHSDQVGAGPLEPGAPGVCSVCLSYPCSVLALPCRHLALCRLCADQVRKVCTQCPICRTRYDALVDLCYIEAGEVISGTAGETYPEGQVGMSLA